MELVAEIVIGVVGTILILLGLRISRRQVTLQAEANQIAKTIYDRESLQRIKAKRSLPELAGLSIQHSGEEVIVRTRVVNQALADARDVKMVVLRNGEGIPAIDSSARVISRNQKDGASFSFRIRTGHFRSAIPEDRYQLIFNYSDDEQSDKHFQHCYQFNGEGNSHGPGQLTAQEIECDMDAANSQNEDLRFERRLDRGS